jgi:hypothetical protein
MLAMMPSSLFTQWMAFDRLEPISLGYRGDMQSGIVAKTIANIYRDPRRRREPFRAEEFMPKYDLPVYKPEPKSVYQKIRDWAVIYGAQKSEVVQ